MKKIVLIVLLALLGLLLLYVGFNRIDAKADPGLFTARDLLPDDFGYENGFYRLWTLGLDDKVDVEMPAAKERFRRLFDPQFDNDRAIREFDVEKYKQEISPNKRMPKALLEELGKIDRIGAAPMVPPEELLKSKGEFFSFREKQPPILRRYEAMLNSGFFQDFTAPRAVSPIPNLLLWLRLAKVHIGLGLADASDGKWLEATDSLLRQANFAKRAVAGSRVLITNLIGKAVLVMSLQGLDYLMNQKECPSEVFSRVLAALPPIRYEEYGSRNAFIGEFLYLRDSVGTISPRGKRFGLGWAKELAATLLLQRNRTLNGHFRRIQSFIRMETDPLQGDPDAILAPERWRRGAFWWLRNPVGKTLLDIMLPNLGVVVFKSLRARSICDMTRISAELHLRYDPSRSVQENLDALDSYRRTPDPCSGKPYVWNGKKQVLYSVGLDRIDGGGVYDRLTARTDVVLPVVLYVRAGE